MHVNSEPASENRAGRLRKVIAFIAGVAAFPIGALLTATIGLALTALAWWMGRALFYIVIEEVFGWDDLTRTIGSIVAATAILIGGLPGGAMLSSVVYKITVYPEKFEKGHFHTAVGLLVFPVGALLGAFLGLYVQFALYAAIRWMLSAGWLKDIFALNNWLELILILSGIWAGGYLGGILVVMLVQQIIVQIRR